MSKIIQKLLVFINLYSFIILAYVRNKKAIIGGIEYVFKSSFVIDEDTTLNEAYNISSQNLDEVTILVVDGARLTLNPGCKIFKIGKNSNEEDISETDKYKYGLTSNIVAIGPGTTVNINGATINVDYPFSNAIVALNGAKITIKNTTIITKSKYSKGIVAMHNGVFVINEKTTIDTKGDFSPCIESSINYASITCNNIFLNTTGLGSPLINNLGDGELIITGGEGNSENSQIMVIQGNNKIGLNNAIFSCYGKGINENNLNNGGIILYKNDEENSILTELKIFHCTLTVNQNIDFPLFSCYNTQADIELDDTKVNYNKTYIIAENTENSSIMTSIKVTISTQKEEINGKVIANNNAHIVLKANSDILKKIEISGDVKIESDILD